MDEALSLERVKDSHPFLVTAPIGRSGTTLVQRLICSSTNAICYGENIGHELLTLADYIAARITFHLKNKTSEIEALNDVLTGKTDRWMPDLSPGFDGYLNSLYEAFCAIPQFAFNFSRSVSRPIWGIKVPAASFEQMEYLKLFLPHLKIIYVYRDIYDCIRSAKSRKFIQTMDQLKNECITWRKNLLAISTFSENNKPLLIRYEDLVRSPDHVIGMLTEFTGTIDIDKRALDRKINTWKGQICDGHSPDQYIAPTALTEIEHETITGITADIRAILYPDPPRNEYTAS